MPFRLGVLVVHGMGSQGPEYAQKMIDEIDQRIDRPNEVCWHAALWSDLLTERENQLWRRLSAGDGLEMESLRRFVIRDFGDAIAYQRVPGMRTNYYALIHERIHQNTTTTMLLKVCRLWPES